jgi:hypothetical protein
MIYHDLKSRNYRMSDELESLSGEKKRKRECGGKLAARDTAYRVRWLI